MTLETIEESLPNGLHDALIRKMSRDFEQATLILRIEVLVGLPSDTEADPNRYRAAQLVFHEVGFVSIEHPDAASAFKHPGSIWFSYLRTQEKSIPDGLREMLPAETLYYSLYIMDWMSEIHLAVGSVSFSWSDPEDAGEHGRTTSER